MSLDMRCSAALYSFGAVTLMQLRGGGAVRTQGRVKNA
jgi:hypothetical protein